MDGNKEKIAKTLLFIPIILFGIFTLWRIYLFISNVEDGSNPIQVWAASYQLIAWVGAFCGFYFAGLWGGRKSLVGRANLAFAIGLLAQSFGQSVFSYFFYKGIETPYPSVADIGFFGSIPFYIYGAALLVKFSHVQISFKAVKNLALAILIPALMLVLSYFFFLRGYEFDWTNKLKIFLDFGYPFGQAIYVSIAIIALLVSRKILGGIMRAPTLLFIFSLVLQFISDYTFLYKSSQGTFVGGGIVDFLYLLSYTLMALSLVTLGRAYYKIKNT